MSGARVEESDSERASSSRGVLAHCLPSTSVVRIGRKAPCEPITPHVPTSTAMMHCIEICARASKRKEFSRGGVLRMSGDMLLCLVAHHDRRICERLLHSLQVLAICSVARGARAHTSNLHRGERAKGVYVCFHRSKATHTLNGTKCGMHQERERDHDQNPREGDRHDCVLTRAQHKTHTRAVRKCATRARSRARSFSRKKRPRVAVASGWSAPRARGPRRRTRGAATLLPVRRLSCLSCTSPRLSGRRRGHPVRATRAPSSTRPQQDPSPSIHHGGPRLDPGQEQGASADADHSGADPP